MKINLSVILLLFAVVVFVLLALVPEPVFDVALATPIRWGYGALAAFTAAHLPLN